MKRMLAGLVMLLACAREPVQRIDVLPPAVPSSRSQALDRQKIYADVRSKVPCHAAPGGYAIFNYDLMAAQPEGIVVLASCATEHGKRYHFLTLRGDYFIPSKSP